MSLRTKIVSLIIGTIALIQLAWGLSVVRSDAALLELEAQRRSRAILHAIAAPAAIHMASLKFETLDAVLEVYNRRSRGELAFKWIAILDMNGKVVSHTDPRQFGQIYTDVFTRRSMVSSRSLTNTIETEGGRKIQVSMPIHSGLRWGTIIGQTSLAGLDSRVIQNQWIVLISTLLIAMSTAILISTLLGRMVFLPLERFAQTSRSIGSGDFTARADVPDTNDEMALLGHTLNEMADRVETQTIQLEAKVRTRTKELKAANSALEEANQNLATAVDELERLASTDGLTSLTNHRTLQEKLVEEVRRSERSKSPLTILMIDVDHFKTYNDMHGHPAGDKVLVQVARIFEESLRNTDIVARYGGEEFAVLLIDTPLSYGAKVADKLRNSIRQANFMGADRSQPNQRITISMGMAGWPIHGTTPAGLIEAADQALYDAKRAGRDQVKMYGGPKT
jgi:diguanylate cyclase (GGDEF)-like protein